MAKITISSRLNIPFEDQPTTQVMISVYYTAFTNFGLLPFLMVLDDLENAEQYEHCYYLVQAINLINKKYNIQLKTRWSNEAINMIRAHWKADEAGIDFETYFAELHKHKRALKEFLSPYINNI